MKKKKLLLNFYFFFTSFLYTLFVYIVFQQTVSWQLESHMQKNEELYHTPCIKITSKWIKVLNVEG